MISYEYPLTEKIRTLLRIEDLFSRMSHFVELDQHDDHHAAMSTLFEILEVVCRAELKSELLQELERQKRALTNLHNNPAISENALSALLSEIDEVSVALLAMSGKVGQHLKDNEWLMSIKQRTAIPGGTCEFDLPSYHFWLHQDANMRRENLYAWLNPLRPIDAAAQIILKLLRESGKVFSFTAAKGTFQQMQGGRVAHMLRVSLDDKLACIPEVGANKYAINIRFIVANYSPKSSLFADDVSFELTFCSLSS